MFDEVCNELAPKIDIVLLLNKRDLFESKLKEVPLSKYFPEYTGGASFNEGCAFMKSLYLSRNKNADRNVYVHFSTATDTKNVKAVFDAVEDVILGNKITGSGLF